MRTTRQMKIENLARALSRLSLRERKSLVEILDRQNLQARRLRARREMAKGKVVSESKLFKDLG